METVFPVWQQPHLADIRLPGDESKGLTTLEASRLLKEFGPNEFPPPPRPRLILRFVNQLTHFMALLLWIAGVLACVAGTPLIGFAIWSVVLINGLFSFAQEYRAERALTVLTELLPLQAKVYRDGALVTVPAREIVVGDLIELEAGDKITADARLIGTEGLLVEMSAITGESVPVVREALDLPAEGGADAANNIPQQRVGDITTIVLAGTTVLSGTARAIAYATGPHTEFGHLARLATTAEKAPNRLEVETGHIVQVITVLACSMGAAVFLVAYGVMGLHPLDSLLLGIGILVANVPEGLLPTVSVALALGVQRMARCNALVRKLSAIEGLSAVSVLCTDKTGTLTLNSMTVQKVWTADGAEERLVCSDQTEIPSPLLSLTARTVLTASALCCHHRIGSGERGAAPISEALGGSSATTDPTETAIREAALQRGLSPQEYSANFSIIQEISFDSHRRVMSVIIDHSGETVDETPLYKIAKSRTILITKGAPDAILQRSTTLFSNGSAIPITPQLRGELRSRYDTIARDGFRVLGVALRPIESAATTVPATTSRDELERDLTLLGYIALFDPIRPEVPAAIAKCRTAGIAVCMVTGDHGATARAIGEMIGLHGIESRPITGDEVASMTDSQLRNVLHTGRAAIFARMDPDQKLRLVRAFRDLGHVVAVTGDGVNDAPALKAAHVGFAMGQRGTDVAREVADVVLLDDNFATIVSAIEQGRSTFDNIRRFLTYILASNIPELVPFICMAALGIPPALTIIQILLVDLGTDLAPAVALGMEKPASDAMQRPPLPPDERLLNWPLVGRAYGLLGVVESIAAMGAFFLVWFSAGFSLEEMRAATPSIIRGTASPELTSLYATATAATFLTIIACQMGNVFACRSAHLAAWHQSPPTNWLLWGGLTIEALIIIFIGYSPIGLQLFNNAPLSPRVWLWLMASPLVLIGIDGVWKWLRGERVGETSSP